MEGGKYGDQVMSERRNLEVCGYKGKRGKLEVKSASRMWKAHNGDGGTFEGPLIRLCAFRTVPDPIH